MSEFMRAYGVAAKVRMPIVKAGSSDFAVSGDWTPATGDVKVSKDGGNVANITTLPTAVGGTGSVLWEFSLSATEMEAAEVVVQVVDSATKAIQDQAFNVHTYGSNPASGIVSVTEDSIAGAVNVVRKNTALSAFMFKMVDATDLKTAETGVTVAATRSIDGAAFGACTNSVTEVSNGWYKIDLSAGDLNGDVVVLRFTGTGCHPTEIVLTPQPTGS